MRSLLLLLFFSLIAQAEVDLRDGALTLTVDDELPSSTQILPVRRHYNSRTSRSGAAGLGWYFEFESRIIAVATGDLIWQQGPNEIRFRIKAGDQSQTLGAWRLTKIKDGWQVSNRHHQAYWRFSTRGELLAWRSEIGPLLKIKQRNAEGQPAVLETAGGRDTLKLVWSIDSLRLLEISSDTPQARIRYQFHTDLLTHVEISGDRARGPNQSRSTSYLYNEDFNLIKISPPNGLTIEYDPQTDQVTRIASETCDIDYSYVQKQCTGENWRQSLRRRRCGGNSPQLLMAQFRFVGSEPGEWRLNQQNLIWNNDPQSLSEIQLNWPTENKHQPKISRKTWRLPGGVNAASTFAERMADGPECSSQ